MRDLGACGIQIYTNVNDRPLSSPEYFDVFAAMAEMDLPVWIHPMRGPGFSDYLFTFFQDKGMPALATTIKEGSKFRILFDVVRDMKRALNRPLYDELMENSFHYAPPYLPLFGFMMQSQKWPMLSLSAMEWEGEETRANFIEYMQKYYPDRNVGEVLKLMDKWLHHSSKSQFNQF